MIHESGDVSFVSRINYQIVIYSEEIGREVTLGE